MRLGHHCPLSRVMRIAADNDDSCGCNQLLKQQIHEQKVPQMINAKSCFKTICGVSCTRNNLDTCVANQGSQGWVPACDKHLGKIADRLERSQVQGQSIDLR